MGTTLNKLEYINTTKAQMKTALNQFGAGITDETTFREYADKINNIYDNWEKVTGEGTDITLTPTKKGKLQLIPKGNATQNGDPTPTTEIDVEVVTGNQDVVVGGKNLFNPDITDLFKLGCNVTESDGEITITATQNGDIYVGNVVGVGNTYAVERGKKIYVKPNTRYTIVSTNNNVNKIFFTEFDSNNISLGYALANTLTTKANTSYIIIRYGLENAVNGTSYKTKIMVAEGTDTTYEPYITPTTYQLSLVDIELCGIGNYKDELIYDVENDKVYKNVNVGKLILNGNETITLSAISDNTVRIRYSYDLLPYTAKGDLLGLCNRLLAKNIWDIDEEGFFFFGKQLIMRINKETVGTTPNSINAWLENNNMIFNYALETEVLEEITDTTLINQVKALYNAHSNNGTTIITSNGNLPMIVKVSALKKGGN